MKYCLHISIFLLIIFLSWTQSYKLVCYYDITSANRVGPARFTSSDMELALHFCTHIIYSYVTITPDDFTLTVFLTEREHEFAKMENYKKKFPNVKFLFSISGEDSANATKRFLHLIRSHNYEKQRFIKSVMEILIKYNFDGVSLDLPLPKRKQNPVSKKTIWQTFINFFVRDKENIIQKHPEEYKFRLTSLIQKLSRTLKEHNAILTLNVLPNVDSGNYYDVNEIVDHLKFVILSAFDFYTPRSSPNQADLMSPTKPLNLPKERLAFTNVKHLYKHWNKLNVPRHKIIVGVAAFGRAWKMSKKSNSNGIPPITHTDGPAAGGSETYTPGLLSWPEICDKLSHDHAFTRVIDPEAKAGVYAFRPADSSGNFGIWISYEDPITIAAKTEYMRNHNLGGVALFDLSLDDIHGECSGEKFPLLRTIKFRISRSYES
ncbi:chitinase-like protein Idgf3 [Cochliomyia hominivorax]